MSIPSEWKAIISTKMLQAAPVVSAHTYLNKKWPSSTHPVLLACDDGNEYVVKSWVDGKSVVNEQVVAFIGKLLGAPIPEVRLVNVPQELIELEPTNLNYLTAGICHGSRMMQNCGDREWIDHIEDNRDRFATLAVLYGWAHSGQDAQLIYELESPHLVWSVDHGGFFPGGPEWSQESLRTAKRAEVLQDLANVSADLQIESVIATIASIIPDAICHAVAVPPSEWYVTLEEREMLATFLEPPSIRTGVATLGVRDGSFLFNNSLRSEYGPG